MIVVHAKNAFDSLCRKGLGKPFSFFRFGVSRECLAVRYNDLSAQETGFEEVANVLIEYSGAGAAVCFSANFDSPDKTLSCPPSRVLDLLATGLYQQHLHSRKVDPSAILVFDHVPAKKDTNPCWADRADWPDMMRLNERLKFSDGRFSFQYELFHGDKVPQIDHRFSRVVPSCVKRLPFQHPQKILDLRAFTPRS